MSFDTATRWFRLSHMDLVHILLEIYHNLIWKVGILHIAVNFLL